MPTTVVQNADRTYGDETYGLRLRRPTYLEALMPAALVPAAPVVYRPAAIVRQPQAPIPSVVTARTDAQKAAIVYQAPAVDVSPGEKAPEMPAEEGAPVAPEAPLPRKKVSPWVWAGAGGATLVVFWLFFRKRR